jgi:hypothetical protein
VAQETSKAPLAQNMPFGWQRAPHLVARRQTFPATSKFSGQASITKGLDNVDSPRFPIEQEVAKFGHAAFRGSGQYEVVVMSY